MWGDKEKTDPLLLEGFGMGNGLHHHPKHLYRQLAQGINGKSRPVVLWKGDTARKKRFELLYNLLMFFGPIDGNCVTKSFIKSEPKPMSMVNDYLMFRLLMEEDESRKSQRRQYKFAAEQIITASSITFEERIRQSEIKFDLGNHRRRRTIAVAAVKDTSIRIE
ncbi:hypothetical protein TELCIR_10928 [Teladorsagia circumcincta]|uniref:Uncharacterized protein n=1 Tax=Teladorsagia circumcincta TaxID=45464 RepID=A0A2G9UAS2_TELCI|nr:hypothetical protein TELCIR_10928 [Teladorsagia circumcincta]